MLHPKKKVRVCACVRLILVLVWGTYYVLHTYVPGISTYVPGISRLPRYVYVDTYVPGWGTYYVPHTYVPGISTYVPGISRIPTYLYVDTYEPGLHPQKKEQNAQHTLRERHTHSATHNAQQRACDNCGQRNRGCSCCLMDRVAHD